LLAAAVLAAWPAWAARLSQGQVRTFVAAQRRAWNAGALDSYFAGFAPQATFTDQYRTPAGQVVPYGASTLPQAQAQSRKFRAASSISEAGQIIDISLAADGRSAAVASRVVSHIESAKGVRVTCADRVENLVLSGGRLMSTGQTDTFSRCAR
jgi:hypothetical protein